MIKRVLIALAVVSALSIGVILLRSFLRTPHRTDGVVPLVTPMVSPESSFLQTPLPTASPELLTTTGTPAATEVIMTPSPGPNPSKTPSPTPKPTATPQPSPKASPVISPTPEPSAPEPTPSPAGGPTPSPTPESARAPREFFVFILSSQFQPQALEILPGDTVTWVNKDKDKLHWPASDPHPTHTAYPGLDPLGDLSYEERYSFTFRAPGTFSYHDHTAAVIAGTATIKGTVVVTE